METILSTISEIIQKPINDSWNVLDSKEDLYLVHHTPDASMTTYGNIRGMVVDIRAGLILTKSPSYMPTAVSAKLDEVSHLQDAVNPNIIYDINNPTLYPGFDGPVISLFLHRGEIKLASEKRIGAAEHWGESEAYDKLFKELGGELFEDKYLFDTTKQYSPYTYRFILIHPELQVVSKTFSDQRLLIYIGYEEMWQDKQENHDNTLREHNFNPFHLEATHEIVSRPEYTLDDANDFLYSGVYNLTFKGDERLLPGEFIIAQTENSNIRIESPSYRWRATMRDGNPFLLDRFYRLTNVKYLDTNTLEGEQQYLERYPIFTSGIEDLEYELPLYMWEFEDEIPRTPQARLFNIYIAFMFSLPLLQQEGVITYYDEYHNNLNKVTKRLHEIYNLGSSWIEYRGVLENAIRIIKDATNLAQRRLGEADIDQVVGEEIGNLVRSEEGTRLLQLVKYFD